MEADRNANEDAAGREFSAPARVNLIGEHTDYTGGLVLPMAIPFTTTVTIRTAADGYTFGSDLFAGARALTMTDRTGRTGHWSDYPVGVLRELQALRVELLPFALELSGDVPSGSGLSSSASVEVATAMALLDHAGKTLPARDIALLCQRAENNFVGSPCGIMDQFVVTAATRGHALLLNTRDLTFDLLPMTEGRLAHCAVIVANSGVKHSIAGGDYGLRRRELEAGQAVLVQRFAGLRDLGDATLEQLTACEASMSPESFRRCRHVVSENTRVRAAAEAMKNGDAFSLGKLMAASHASQRDDFECSVAEIDFLVDTASAIDGCHGARLTGGGFGGCTVSLVEDQHAAGFTTALRNAYRAQFGLDLPTYTCHAVDGAMARNASTRRQQENKPC